MTDKKSRWQEMLDTQSRCLRIVRDTCDRYGVQIFLDQGTLLGAIRDKSFIEGDHDIDVGTLCTNKDKLFKVFEDLKSMGWKAKKYEVGEKLCWLSFRVEKTIIDVQIYYLINGRHCFKVKKYYVHVSPIFKFKKIFFLDDEYIVPDPPEKHLGELYTNWKERGSEICLVGPHGISIYDEKSELLKIFNAFFGVEL